VKKLITTILAFTLIFALIGCGENDLNLPDNSAAPAVEHMPILTIGRIYETGNLGTLFINNVEIDSGDPVVVAYGLGYIGIFEDENESWEADSFIEDLLLFSLQTIIESLGGSVSAWECGENEFSFNLNGIDYAVRLEQIEYDSHRTLNLIYISNGGEYLQLNSVSANGTYIVINDVLYLCDMTGQRLFESLGFSVYTDWENHIVRIYSAQSNDNVPA